MFVSQLPGVFTDMGDHASEVLQIEKHQPFVISQFEFQIEYGLLGVIQVQQTNQQRWAQIGMVARIGCPCSEYTSQKMMGVPS